MHRNRFKFQNTPFYLKNVDEHYCIQYYLESLMFFFLVFPNEKRLPSALITGYSWICLKHKFPEFSFSLCNLIFLVVLKKIQNSVKLFLTNCFSKCLKYIVFLYYYYDYLGIILQLYFNKQFKKYIASSVHFEDVDRKNIILWYIYTQRNWCYVFG